MTNKKKNESDEETLVKAVTSVLTYYRQSISAPVLEVWTSGLRQFDVRMVVAALNAHIADPDNGRFPPWVSDVIRMLQGTTSDRAQIAWSTVIETAARVGSYTDVLFDDPAIHAAIHDIGGWPQIGRTEFKQLGFLQARFATAYKHYSNRAGYDYPAVCIGDRDPDAMFERKGIKPPPPAVIGDRRMCRRVYERNCWNESRIIGTLQEVLTHDSTPTMDPA